MAFVLPDWVWDDIKRAKHDPELRREMIALLEPLLEAGMFGDVVR